MPQVLLYRGFVTDSADPIRQGRLRVRVPDLGPNGPTGWAKLNPGNPGKAWSPPPQLDDQVTIVFEGRGLNFPVAFPPVRDLFPGLQIVPGLVIDVMDPLARKRVQVRIPALGDIASSWAPLCTPLTPTAAGAVAADTLVAVTFAGGDVNLPVVLGALF